VKERILKGIFAALLLASPIVGAESKFPAADFEPKILFQDSDLIAKHAARPIQIITSPTSTFTEEATETAGSLSGNSGAQSDNALAQNYPIALVVLALIGFALWGGKGPRSKKAVESQGTSAVVLNGTPGDTGVAKYLKSIGASGNLGVGETGVAKYLKSLTDSVASAAETGVSRYLKNVDK
jgi:hypothetical protein